MIPVRQAAKRLGVSQSLLYSMVSKRDIPHFRIRGKILFEEADLDGYKERCRVEAATASAVTTSRPRRLKHIRLLHA